MDGTPAKSTSADTHSLHDVATPALKEGPVARRAYTVRRGTRAPTKETNLMVRLHSTTIPLPIPMVSSTVLGVAYGTKVDKTSFYSMARFEKSVPYVVGHNARLWISMFNNRAGLRVTQTSMAINNYDISKEPDVIEMTDVDDDKESTFYINPVAVDLKDCKHPEFAKVHGGSKTSAIA